MSNMLVGNHAPEFSAQAVINGNEIIEGFSLKKYLNKSYVLFFFYPKDFTFVCPTELHAFQDKLSEFEKHDVAIVACSTDSAESHYEWLQKPKKKGGIEGVTYPIVSDATKTISENFGVLAGDYSYDEDGDLVASGPMIAYRGLFIIDKKGIVRHVSINDLGLGRNVDESLRLIQALQYVEKHGEVCPANWQKGDKAIVPNKEGILNHFSN